MEDKEINKIKGSYAYKIILYVLIAVTAFTAVITAGLTCQAYYYGAYKQELTSVKQNVKQMLIEKCVNEKTYVIDNMLSEYVDEKTSVFKDIKSPEKLKEYDTNGDGKLTWIDIVPLLSGEKDLYNVMKEKIGGYNFDIPFACSISIKVCGEDRVINHYQYDMSNLSSGKSCAKYEYSLSVPVYQYSFFDNYDDMLNDQWNEEFADYDNLYNLSVDSICADGGADGEYKDVKDGYINVYQGLTDSAFEADVEFWMNDADIDALIRKEMEHVYSNLDIWYKYKYIIAGTLAISMLLCLIFSIISMAHAGVKKGVETIKLNVWEKIPTEFIVAAECGAVILIGMFFSELLYWSGFYGDYDFGLKDIDYWFISAAIALTFTAALLLLNTVITNIKAKTVLKNSLIVKLYRYLFGKTGKISGWFRYVKRRIPFVWKAILIYAIILIGGFLLLAMIGADYGMLMSMILFAVIIVTLFYIGFIIIINELYKGGKELARGNLTHKIDTKYMFGAFREHGENLNSINDSIQLAVDERMKSEHMKTELITNVSHDIKTPLTSIINYVDLLEKGDIDKDTEKSYIDVLARQSARLKKLIVDLVDASKASTGNVQMNMECMDANMLLTQGVAEYEEKLESAGMKLVLKTTDEAAYIMADGRHLWRVFDNLLNNTYKYAMNGTRVYAQVEQDDKTVRIIFKNISKEPLNISSDELMERFVRGDSSRNTEGSGLGLSIAQSLCGLMGAKFTIQVDGDLFKAVVLFDRIERGEEVI